MDEIDHNDLQQTIIQRLSAENEQLKQALAIESANRRQLHNDIYDAKGNIRVIARVRPLTKAEESRHEQPKVIADTKTNSICVQEKATGKTIRVGFDKSFGASSTQDEVFQEVAPLVNSILDGFNASIFAYGQTGSGKTFTMTGSVQNRGVTFRMIESLFQTAQRRSQEFPGSSYQFQISAYEIYNETLRDLLANDETPREIKIDPETGLKYVSNATKINVVTLQHAWNVVEQSVSNRTVASTEMNASSSRSHMIIMIDVQGHNSSLDPSASFTRSRFCCVDLAGSERVAESGAQGANLKEAAGINTSLSVLSRVINSLAQKSKIAPPYRESKLTWLLHDALSGQAKTVMFIQCSPIESSVSQTLQTLQFASRVKSIEVTSSSANVDHARAMAALKKQYEDEIETMKIQFLQKEAQLHSQLEYSAQEILQLRSIIEQQQQQNEQLVSSFRGIAQVSVQGNTMESGSPMRDSTTSPGRSTPAFKRTPMPAKRKSRSPAAAEAPQPRPDLQTSIAVYDETLDRDLLPKIAEEEEDADSILNSFVSDFTQDNAMEIDDKENYSYMMPASPLQPVRVISRPTISCLKSCLINRQLREQQKTKKRVRWDEAFFDSLLPDAKRQATTTSVQTGPSSYKAPTATPRFNNALARRPVNALPPSSPYRLTAPMKAKVAPTPSIASLGAPGRRVVATVATPGRTPSKVAPQQRPQLTPGGLNRSKLAL